jgi:phospholipid/cholesterol/gamma-HCH transport system ATP-binding protein
MNSVDTALELVNVHRTFHGRPVLKDLTVRVPRTGLTFVVGQSGSGKSVLCRLAVGLLRPDAGQVLTLGRPVHALPERKLRELRTEAPYLVQGPALLDWLSVEDNVRLTAPGRSAEVARAALERLGLWASRAAMPPTLGPSVKKRVALARALALSPRYLLLDEPTTGLDRGAARQVNQAIAQIKADGLGALVVSHDYESLRRLADWVVVVGDGRCIFEGCTGDFFDSLLPAVRTLTSSALKGPPHG